ncbi:MAG TPA: ectonucleotide pyrophosphatase/phosphodiesterase [Gemmatimonadaceae bacterium]|nr:ectonucleotide pyrophosphatase/phosphodiesterase [Gemmatimonadaceae bacterium]
MPPSRSGAPAPVILVSIDGGRHDYLDSFPTPALHRLAQDGVRADGMRPTFPSVTFPNHYTLVTGWYPEDHHIVANTVYDSVTHHTLTMGSAAEASWWSWRGEPIWVTAAKHGLKTATMFWPASEAQIDGYRPTYWRAYNHQMPDTARVAQVLTWLDLPPQERPALLTLYFDAVDQAGHIGGPWSPGTRAAVIHIDSMIALLVRGLEMRHLAHTVNLVIVADHGMTVVNRQQTIAVADVIDTNTVLTAEQGPYMWLQAKDGDQAALLAALQRLPHLRAYFRTDAPLSLHVRHHPGHFAILALADDGWSILKSRSSSSPSAGRSEEVGAHGYDPAYPSMWALFIAHGPSFQAGTRLAVFDNVHVYALLAHLLNVPPAPNAGDLSVFAPVLQTKIDSAAP